MHNLYFPVDLSVSVQKLWIDAFIRLYQILRSLISPALQFVEYDGL